MGESRSPIGNSQTAFGVVFVAAILFWLWASRTLGTVRVEQITVTAQLTALKLAALIVLTAVTILILAVCIARLLRPRSATIFVSYPHEQGAVALAVANALETQGLEVRIIPFVDRRDAHDTVISEVVTNIQKSDVLVVVTATRSPKQQSAEPRFYESEILAATVAHKPVVLLAREQQFNLPSTAYRGYPVLGIVALEAEEWVPLATILHLAVGTKETVTQAVATALKNTFVTSIAIWFLLLVSYPLLLTLAILSAVLLGLFRGLAAAVSTLVAFKSALFGLCLVGIAAGAFLAFLCQLHKQLRLRRKFRDDFARRQMTNRGLATLLHDLDSGNGIIACLLPSAPAAEQYEVTEN